MSDKFTASQENTLLLFLGTHLNGWSRKKIKQRLQTGCVEVNGEAYTKHDHPLKQGDTIEVLAAARKARPKISQLEILFSDDNLIAINKPAGLLSVSATGESKGHALSILRDQLSSSKNPVKLWPVHRLDRDTSGVLLFATSHEMRENVATDWSKSQKIYMAIVEGRPDPKSGTIMQPLRLDEKEYRMHVGPHPNAKRAVTHYETVESKGKRSLLKVKLDTGRQHQIRAHLSWLKYPIVGDMRYGKAGPRMGLHALSLSLTHPITKKRLHIDTPAPEDFLALLK